MSDSPKLFAIDWILFLSLMSWNRIDLVCGMLFIFLSNTVTQYWFSIAGLLKMSKILWANFGSCIKIWWSLIERADDLLILDLFRCIV